MKRAFSAIAAFGLWVTGWATGAVAQSHWDRPGYRPPPVIYLAPQPGFGHDRRWRRGRSVGWCEANAARLRHFEWQVAHAGRVSVDEMRIASSLRADHARNCRGKRWSGRRVDR